MSAASPSEFEIPARPPLGGWRGPFAVWAGDGAEHAARMDRARNFEQGKVRRPARGGDVSIGGLQSQVSGGHPSHVQTLSPWASLSVPH